LHELAEHLVLGAVAERLQLDLAAGRGDDGPEVAHTRRHLALVEPDGALERVRQEVLPVADADAHRHDRALTELRRLARQVRCRGRRWGSAASAGSSLIAKSPRLVRGTRP